MSINLISGNILNANLVRGANLAISSSSAGANLIFIDTVNGRVGVRTNAPTQTLDVAGVLRVGNVSISNVGNINAGNVNINNLLDPVANTDAATKFYVDTVTGNITANLGNITIANTTISPTITPGNITLQTTGNSTVIIDTTSGLVLPVGNTVQRPTPAVTGTVRFNTDSDRAEIYDGTEWDSLTGNVTAQAVNGDGSTLVFVLDRASTTAATLVIINGVVQMPTTAYSVSGNTLTFTQAPDVSDAVDIRFL
jgi:hypothetical protein